jgi:hypothetical protein
MVTASPLFSHLYPCFLKVNSMVGLEVVAPKGLAFVSYSCYSMQKGSNGYNNPTVRAADGCEKIKDEPTRLMIINERERATEQWFSCVMTDAEGNITPWAAKIELKKMVPQQLTIPSDGGSAVS